VLKQFSINVDYSINSGQVFLWEKDGNTWYGINGTDILTIKENPFEINSFSQRTLDFFREQDEIEKIIQSVSKDVIVRKAVILFSGLRLLRQDPFQCYISFIISSNSSIQKIKMNLQQLCRKFGKRIVFEKKEFYLFPEPNTLAKATKNNLLNCGIGYRAKAVKEASLAVTKRQIDFNLLKKANYKNAKDVLLEIFGIGNKIADCIMLFSLDKLDAFPIDRWVLRILKKYYAENFQFDGKSLTEKKYNETHEKIVNHFGPYAGYAQQFLFKMERDLNQKKWL